MSIETCPLSIQDIKSELAEIRETAAQNNSRELLETALSCIDLTTLNPTDTISSVRAFTEKVNQFPSKYSELKNVAAICIYPNMAQTVKETLKAK